MQNYGELNYRIMRVRKLLIPIQGNFVPPRFDLARDILIIRCENRQVAGAPIRGRFCRIIIEEYRTDPVCGGIEKLHYNLLAWKKCPCWTGSSAGREWVPAYLWPIRKLERDITVRSSIGQGTADDCEQPQHYQGVAHR